MRRTTQSNIFFFSFIVSAFIDSIPQGNIWQQILSFHFILELVTTVPFVFTVRTQTTKTTRRIDQMTNFLILPYRVFFFLGGTTDIMATNAKLIYSNIFELLACQTLAGEYVRKYRRSCVFSFFFYLIVIHYSYSRSSLRASQKNKIHFHFQNDLHRAMQKSQSALSQQLTILSATLLCLVFTR